LSKAQRVNKAHLRKVAVVASKFAPHAGGTAVVWTQWCSHWPAGQLTVIAPKIAGWREFDSAQAYRIVRCAYPDIPKIRMPWLWLHQAARLMNECLKCRPPLIHLSHVFENGFMGPILKACLGIPYFVHTYGEELVYAWRRPGLRQLVSKVLDQADGVTTISRYTEGLHRRFGFDRPALMVHPAVDTERYHIGPSLKLAQRKFGLPEGPLLLTTGRLMKRKGHDSVIRLLPTVLQSFPDLNYAIAGVGPYQENLQRLVEELGLARRVHFLGRVSDEDLPVLTREASLFVHPNRITEDGDVEGFGIVFLEAAASGVAVIGGRSGGVPDSVNDGVNGVLVETDQELYNQLIRLLSDHQLRQEMGTAGREWARSFSWGGASSKVWDYSFSQLRQH
ncbi:MAG: glycosyltransferase family 4 protein, partial [Pirellulales bacterium]